MSPIPRILRVAGLLLACGTAALADDAPGGRALIVVGLPGDAEHEAAFRATARAWRDWLTGPLRFPEAGVRVLSNLSPSDGPATREAIGREARSLREAVPARVWVFVLGHADVRDGHAFLHIPGPDLRDDEFAALFEGLEAPERVFWMTGAASGRFLPSLEKPGRVVLAATAPDDEPNETEFPAALVAASRLPASVLDLDRDGRVSVREVFDATARLVASRFADDGRVPTEHPQAAGVDLGSKTFLPQSPPRPPDRSDHATDRVVPPAR